MILKKIFNTDCNVNKICVCVGIRNRGKQLLNLISSILLVEDMQYLSLSIFDCHSDDVLDLEGRIRSMWKGTLYYSRSNMLFTRAKSFNAAAKQSTEDIIFMCDSDLILPVQIVQLINGNVSENKTWFPIVFKLYENCPAIESPENGCWQYGGFGNVIMHRKIFEAIGGYDESFKQWGGEDNKMWDTIKEKHRSLCKGMFHIWHPTTWEFKSKLYNT